MVFGPATICDDGFEVWQPLDMMVFQWFPMVANHWSNDGMVKIHRYGLFMSIWRMGSWGRGALRPYAHPPAACVRTSPLVSTTKFQIP